MLRVDFCVATKRLLLTALPADFPSLQVSAAEAGAVSLCFQALAAVFGAELVAEVVFVTVSVVFKCEMFGAFILVRGL